MFCYSILFILSIVDVYIERTLIPVWD